VADDAVGALDGGEPLGRDASAATYSSMPAGVER
jgi:hypothetical protein